MCVIGPSGCGKSTLARILAGLEDSTSGEVLLDGAPIHGPGPDRGMVFQGYTLFPWLTVLKNVMFGLEITQSLRGPRRSAKPGSGSTSWGSSGSPTPTLTSSRAGMKQRVAIARALANRAAHPARWTSRSARSTPRRAAQMQGYLLQIWKLVDVTIVFITHDLEEAVYLADRILVLDAHPGGVRELMEVPCRALATPTNSCRPRSWRHAGTSRTLIHPRTEGARDALPMVRMTQVGDDVE